MSKRLIYFTSIVLMAIAITAIVYAEENAPLLNDSADYDALNASSNISLNETLNATVSASANIASNETMNQTVQNEIVVVNETAPFMNSTLEENAIMSGANDSATVAVEITQPKTSEIAAVEDTIFSIGGGAASGNLFQINGNKDPQQSFEINMPIKPIVDVSKVFFACNII